MFILHITNCHSRILHPVAYYILSVAYCILCARRALMCTGSDVRTQTKNSGSYLVAPPDHAVLQFWDALVMFCLVLAMAVQGAWGCVFPSSCGPGGTPPSAL